MCNVLIRDSSHFTMRIARFALVGIVASGVYAVAGLSLVDGLNVPPVIASGLAYMTAIPVSFLGQKHFTFGSCGAVRRELSRFILVQALNLVLAAGIMALITDLFGQSHRLGIIVVIVSIPAVTYVLLATSVFHAYKDRQI